MKTRTRAAAWLLAAVMALGAAGCGNADGTTAAAPQTTAATAAETGAETTAPEAETAETQAAGISGTYSGRGDGKGGEIVVEVTLADGSLSAIQVTEHHETEGIAEAMDILASAMIAGNTLSVDSVAGATITSAGFKLAVTDALESAGMSAGDLTANPAKAEEPRQSIEETHDIIVVGAGGAGFCAAIEAKMAGADVIILEKLPIAGGNTLLSGAEYAAPGNWLEQKEDIEDSPELMKEDMLVGGDQLGQPELVEVVAQNALAGAEWLRDEVNVVWEDELMFFGGHSVKRSLIPLGASGVEIIKKEKAKAAELGIPIYYETRATELITDENGRVTGVKAEGENADYTFTAGSVILATGGFGSNMEMRMQYDPKAGEGVLSTNSVGSTGDGVLMAQAIGAGVTGMEYIQTYPICDPLSGALLYFDDARLYGYSVIVNKEGRRFVEELGRRDEMSQAIVAQTDGCCYELIDQAAFEASAIEENHGPEVAYLLSHDMLVKADTLEEAAGFFGIDAEALKETVDNYNRYVQDGEDPEYHKRSLPSEIGEGPYWIVKAVPAVHHTMGGVCINPEAQVLDTNGNVIEGLYAAGEVTGGIHGSNRLGSCALADITVFGRIAGQNAAAQASR